MRLAGRGAGDLRHAPRAAPSTHESRHKLGAHFTPRAYVERLVVPTIVEPVRDDWETARVASLAQANAGKIDKAKAEARRFLDDLGRIRVLDPACGTGNFLYVSMVKLKEIEAEARDWLGQLGETQADLEHMEQTVDPKQFLGIEINPRAVAIAEVVLWIGWLQWHLREEIPRQFFRADPPCLRQHRMPRCAPQVGQEGACPRRTRQAGESLGRDHDEEASRHRRGCTG